MARPKLYDDLAGWWPLLSAPEDYAEEAAFYEGVLSAASESPPRHVLELGSGGGNKCVSHEAQLAAGLAEIVAVRAANGQRVATPCARL